MDRRNKKDRRSGSIAQERLFPCDRRRIPDRRLNNIAVEWIPFEQAGRHPLTRFMFWK